MAPVSREAEEQLIDALCGNSISPIEYARSIAAQQVNTVQLMTYYSLGKWIVEVQQNGASRASYGKQVMKRLSSSLTEKFGRGFSVDTLEKARKFYLIYTDRISATAFRKFAVEKSATALRIFDENAPFKLTWSHYLVLIRIRNEQERNSFPKPQSEALNEALEVPKSNAETLGEALEEKKSK